MTTPNRIGKYEEPQLIGQGGFGSVYRAWAPDLRRYVAIKVMHPQFAQDAEWVDRFQEEARFMARVDQHPNVEAGPVGLLLPNFVPGLGDIPHPRSGDGKPCYH